MIVTEADAPTEETACGLPEGTWQTPYRFYKESEMPRVKKTGPSGDSRLALGREIGAKLAKLDKADRELVLEVASSIVAAKASSAEPVLQRAVKRAAVKRQALGSSPMAKATAAVKAAVKAPPMPKPATVAAKEDED